MQFSHELYETYCERQKHSNNDMDDLFSNQGGRMESLAKRVKRQHPRQSRAVDRMMRSMNSLQSNLFKAIIDDQQPAVTKSTEFDFSRSVDSFATLGDIQQASVQFTTEQSTASLARSKSFGPFLSTHARKPKQSKLEMLSKKGANKYFHTGSMYTSNMDQSYIAKQLNQTLMSCSDPLVKSRFVKHCEQT